MQKESQQTIYSIIQVKTHLICHLQLPSFSLLNKEKNYQALLPIFLGQLCTLNNKLIKADQQKREPIALQIML